MAHFLGIMTGTSLDGVDVALLTDGRYRAHHSLPLPPALGAELRALNQSGSDEIHRAAIAADELARLAARAIAELLEREALPPTAIAAVGYHGQTIRHRPDGRPPYTVQIQDAALLAELSGITVITDFRRRDVAAGGQGAPLAPLFQRAFFPQRPLAVVNIGGFANISLLAAADVRGWDSGPGNVLLDYWVQLHQRRPYDAGGAWARSGRLCPELLEVLLADPYFQRPPPKSTGRDDFHPRWLGARLASVPTVAPADVQRTLLELTATTIATDLRRHSPGPHYCLMGGGAHNDFLCERLAALLPGWEALPPPLPAEALEAAGFAWLAAQCLAGKPLELGPVTGGQRRILGAIYPA